MTQQFIFGYGSLVDVERLKRYLGRREDFVPETLFYCHLHGYRRYWNVAMDNRRDIPGYKYYLDAETAARPAIYVTFLNIEPSPGDSVYGVLFAVSPTELQQLDARERNYRRLEVTDALSQPLHGQQAWAYVGLPEAKQRFQTGLAAGTVVISQTYHELVYQAYQQLGKEAAHAYQTSTAPANLPLRPLRRVDIEPN